MSDGKIGLFILRQMFKRGVEDLARESFSSRCLSSGRDFCSGCFPKKAETLNTGKGK